MSSIKPGQDGYPSNWPDAEGGRATTRKWFEKRGAQGGTVSEMVAGLGCSADNARIRIRRLREDGSIVSPDTVVGRGNERRWYLEEHVPVPAPQVAGAKPRPTLPAPRLDAHLSEREREVLAYLAKHPGKSATELANAFRLSRAWGDLVLKSLRDAGRVTTLTGEVVHGSRGTLNRYVVVSLDGSPPPVTTAPATESDTAASPPRLPLVDRVAGAPEAAAKLRLLRVVKALEACGRAANAATVARQHGGAITADAIRPDLETLVGMKLVVKLSPDCYGLAGDDEAESSSPPARAAPDKVHVPFSASVAARERGGARAAAGGIKPESEKATETLDYIDRQPKMPTTRDVAMRFGLEPDNARARLQKLETSGYLAKVMDGESPNKVERWRLTETGKTRLSSAKPPTSKYTPPVADTAPVV